MLTSHVLLAMDRLKVKTNSGPNTARDHVSIVVAHCPDTQSGCHSRMTEDFDRKSFHAEAQSDSLSSHEYLGRPGTNT